MLPPLTYPSQRWARARRCFNTPFCLGVFFITLLFILVSSVQGSSTYVVPLGTPLTPRVSDITLSRRLTVGPTFVCCVRMFDGASNFVRLPIGVQATIL